MARKMRSARWIAAVLVAVFTLGGSLAWAAAKPKSGATYFSTKPSVEIFVQKGGASVTLYANCSSENVISAFWDSPKLRLHNDSFSFDTQTTVDKVQQEPFTTTPYKATVLFTGKFKNGKFTGKVQLGGSSCAESSYTAHFSSHGGGEGA